jgi:cytochrome c-type biogenesis protein CcmH/NrfG
VTATLAEIYASQGEYNEAIEAYRTLAAQRPGSAERYQKRLAELEELRRNVAGNAEA